MVEVDIEEIRQKAHSYHENGTIWHFHILTPSCLFNDQNRYAFILEAPDKNEHLVHYSDRQEKELGMELAPIVHGANIFQKKSSATKHQPSATIRKIIDRAAELNQRGIEWHHHILFPGCIFNGHSPQYAFVFEDSETGQKLENLTDYEPDADIKLIEPLFYKK